MLELQCARWSADNMEAVELETHSRRCLIRCDAAEGKRIQLLPEQSQLECSQERIHLWHHPAMGADSRAPQQPAPN